MTKIEETGHRGVIDSAVEATCTSTGLTEGSHCLTCGITLTAQQVIPKTEHKQGNTSIQNRVEVTCTADGSYETVTYCSDCGTEISREKTIINATGHTATEWKIDVQSDCTHAGSKHEECTVCGAILSVAEIPQLEHTLVIDEAVEPGCAFGGLTQGSHCSVCGTVIVKQEYLYPTYNHVAGEMEVVVITAPTCTTEGEHENRTYCIYCGIGLEFIKVTDSATGHTPNEWTTFSNATCTENGFKYQTCATCGDTIGMQLIEPLGHDFVYYEGQPATCLNEGYKDYAICSRCKYSTYTTIPATGHSYGDWYIETKAKCENEGVEKRVCENDSSHYETRAIVATGHDYTISYSWYNFNTTCMATARCKNNSSETITESVRASSLVKEEATCTAKGVKVLTAVFENALFETQTKEIELSVKAHTEVIDEAIVATCTSTGLTQGSHCSVCGVVLTKQEVVDKIAHTASDWVVDVEADCTQKGSKHTYCTKCNTILEIAEIEAKGHTEVIDKAVEATCTSTGLTEGKHCSVCETVLTAQTVIDKIAHTASDWVIDAEARCEQKGSKHTYCTVCNTILEIAEIAETGHIKVAYEAVEPTCTTAGLTEGTYCEVCGALLVKQEVVQALGHKSSDWIVDRVATTTEEGSRHKECTRCGEVLEQEKIDKLEDPDNVKEAVTGGGSGCGTTATDGGGDKLLVGLTVAFLGVALMVISRKKRAR
jgi:hypothetical protein